jgi:hypothetical protein
LASSTFVYGFYKGWHYHITAGIQHVQETAWSVGVHWWFWRLASALHFCGLWISGDGTTALASPMRQAVLHGHRPSDWLRLFKVGDHHFFVNQASEEQACTYIAKFAGNILPASVPHMEVRRWPLDKYRIAVQRAMHSVGDELSTEANVYKVSQIVFLMWHPVAVWMLYQPSPPWYVAVGVWLCFGHWHYRSALTYWNAFCSWVAAPENSRKN